MGSPTLPFTDAEIARIVEAVERYPDRPPGGRRQLKAFILLLRFTGLRIGDVVRFSKDKLSEGKIFLRTQKTGQRVWLPIPSVVEEALTELPERPFWSGNGMEKNGVKAWERSIRLLFKLASVKGHPHQFRCTFAVQCLRKSVSLENVAILLGNSIRIAEKHYAPHVKSRQLALEEEVKRAFS
jgi:integrase